MKALLIRNKKAGDGSVSRKALTAAMEEAGWTVACLPRKKASPKAIARAGADLVAVAGGDGTVAGIVKMLPDRSIPFAIIPSGTANNIARSLGICGTPEASIAAWDRQRCRRLDVGNVHGDRGCRRFVEGVGFGAFAQSLRTVIGCEDEGKADCPTGREALRSALREAKALPLAIEIDGAPLAGEVLMLEVMNIPMTGPRLPLAPDARPGDGMLHISWLPVGRRAAMIRWLGKEQGDPPVEQRTGREIRLAGGGAAMRVDDEACWLEIGSEVTVRLEGAPVQVLAPPHAPALAG
jgi:diacylglycerol kinase (ATP)